jgi:hypothetical protein
MALKNMRRNEETGLHCIDISVVALVWMKVLMAFAEHLETTFSLLASKRPTYSSTFRIPRYKCQHDLS